MDAVPTVPGRLKLKRGSGVLKKKRKSKSTSIESGLAGRLTAKIPHSTQDEQEGDVDKTKYVKKLRLDGEVSESTVADAEETDAVDRLPPKTKSQKAFEERQKKLQGERIFKKAQMSHREKVEQFNDHLNELTEFNDIPKVSWTK